MKDFNELLKDVERDLVVSLVLSLKQGRMTKNEAKRAANEFVSEKFQTHEELFGKLYFMSNSYREVRKVFVKYAPAYFEEKDIQALNELRNYRLTFFMKGGE